MANLFLAILIGLMIVRDGGLLIRHRRPFRLAFVAFWALLGHAHLSGRRDLYPVVALTLVAALILRHPERSNFASLLEPAAEKAKPEGPGARLWDRELDGGA